MCEFIFRGQSMHCFERYYEAFLNFDPNCFVVESEFRNKTLNEKFLYPILVSDYFSHRICSVASQHFKICDSAFNGTFKSLEDIVDTLNEEGCCLRIRKFRRYTLETSIERDKTTAVALTEDFIRNSGLWESINKEAFISRKKALLDSQRYFIVVKDETILSEAYISDIYASGCNIVVNTYKDHKRQGYGKEVVKACINWCLENDLLPIYWVEESNVSSIGLAEGLGFELKCLEWVVSK
jgi:GNAT superfamily N-acetyltransferase